VAGSFKLDEVCEVHGMICPVRKLRHPGVTRGMC
jgi:hypothetical protein